jgi:hypothetical protein
VRKPARNASPDSLATRSATVHPNTEQAGGAQRPAICAAQPPALLFALRRVFENSVSLSGFPNRKSRQNAVLLPLLLPS